jgi:hypothetical protein
VLATAPLALAQQPAAPPNDELTQAILRYALGYRGGYVRVVSGAVPDDLAPNFYAPPGTRVLGTVVLTSGAVVLATTTASADSLRAQYARALAPRGWKPWETRVARAGGFVDAANERPLVLCHERAELQIVHRRRATPAHDLQLEYRDGGWMCDQPTDPRSARFASMEGPPFPTLQSPEPPPSRPTQACFPRMSRRGGSGASTGTVVSSDFPPTELLRYYGRQLEASGWTPPGQRGAPARASGTWTRTDSTGVVQVTIEVTEPTTATGCYEVQMRLSVPR